MIDRRDFVRSTAATLAGGSVLALDATAAPRPTEPTLMRVVFRWSGGGLTTVPDWSEHIGDYVLFLRIDRGRATGPFDVFCCEDPPPGVASDLVLTPLGRNAAVDGARVAIDTHLRETWAAMLRGDGPAAPTISSD